MDLINTVNISRFLPVLHERFAEMNGIDYKIAQEVRTVDEAVEQIRSGTHRYYGNFRNNLPAALLIEREADPDSFVDVHCPEIEWLVACSYSKGSGRELLGSYLQKQQPVRLDVSVENHRAIRLYHDNGFEIIGAYGKKDPMYVMALRF